VALGVAVGVAVAVAVTVAVAVAVGIAGCGCAVSGGIGGAGGGVLSPPHAIIIGTTPKTKQRISLRMAASTLGMRYKATVIGRLTGRVVHEEVDGVVLDVHGVGYEITIPLGTLGRAARADENLVTLFVHTHVREDALALFGFASETDRIAFRTLIGVSNVGPKTAIGVLSVLPAEELAVAVSRNDLGKLTAIPGVGKKTAERLVLELKDKLASRVAPAPGAQPTMPAAHKPSGQGEMLHDALVRMGYRPSEAERAVAQLQERVESQPLSTSVREALALLAK